MTKKSVFLTVLLVFGLVAPLFAADSKKADLNDDQKHRIRYALILIDEYDYDHAAMVIEPLINEVSDYDISQDIYYAYRGLLIGTYEQVQRARYVLLSLLD